MCRIKTHLKFSKYVSKYNYFEKALICFTLTWNKL